MRERLPAYGIALAVVVLDRITKIFINLRFSVWDSRPVIPGFFNIVHTENPGAAFSLLARVQSGWRTIFLVVLSSSALVIISVLLWRLQGRAGESRAMRWGLSLILGGAFGNLCDRVARGTVTDFLEFYYNGFSWPAFNVADSAITIGAALVLLDMLRTRRAPQTT